MPQVQVDVPPVPPPVKRFTLYGEQLRRRASQNDPLWQETLTTLQRLEVLRKLIRTRERVENAMFYIALIGCGAVIVESEWFWIEMHHQRTTINTFSATFLTLKSILSISSCLLVLLCIQRYRLACEMRVANRQLAQQTKFYHASSGFLWRFLLEVLVCSFHIPVFWSSMNLKAASPLLPFRQYNVAFCIDQLDVLVFLRIYLLGRFLRNVFGFQATSHQAHFIGAFHHVDVMSIWFTIKYSFQKFPFASTAMALAIDWILTSAAVNFLERGDNDQLNNADDAVWVTIVTMTGVGYGEIAPKTLGGKLTIAFGAIIGGSIITCLLRVVLIDALLITPQEKIVLEVVQFHRYVRKSKDAAAFLIQRAWKWSNAAQHKKELGTKDQTRPQSLGWWRPHDQEAAFKHGMYAAAEAFRLVRFSRPIVATNALLPSSSSSTSSSRRPSRRRSKSTNPTISAPSIRGGWNQMTGHVQIDHIHQHIQERHERTLMDIHAITNQLRAC